VIGRQLSLERALRRVTLLVAEQAPESEVLDAVVLEATQLLAPAQIHLARDNGDGTRSIETPVAAPDRTAASAAASAHRQRPVVVDAQVIVGDDVWGVLSAEAESLELMPEDAAHCLGELARLAASSIVNTRTSSQLRDLADEQAALRRLAIRVAQGTDPERLFDAIAKEVAHVFGVAAISLMMLDHKTQLITLIAATHGERSAMPLRASRPVSTSPMGQAIIETGAPARIDDWSLLPGPIAERHRKEGFGPSIGAPIVVDGIVWGFIYAFGEANESFPPGCEGRLAAFTSLMATAISNVEAREELRSLADEQRALRRVATLVAQSADPQEVFEAVAEEASLVLAVGAVSLIRYDAESELFTKMFGTHGERAAVVDGSSWGMPDCPEGALIHQTRLPVRIDDWSTLPGPVAALHRERGFGQTVAAPIIIEGAIWGHIAAFGEAGEILAPDCQYRLADFTNLMASAIANAQGRDELRNLAEKQGAALRRVATLVAQQVPPSEIFDAVAREASNALEVERVGVVRCHADGTVSLLGSAGSPTLTASEIFVSGDPGVVAMVTETGKPARIDDWSAVPGAVGSAARRAVLRSVVGAPIYVDDGIWGVIVVLTNEILPPDAATRLIDFTHLIGSSISNVHARDNLIASRARIVTASDETQRRIERNLHDGIQQRIVALGLSLRALRTGDGAEHDLNEGLDELGRDLDAILEEVRIFSRGLHPALLARGGVGPSLRELARRSPIPATVSVADRTRLPEPVEAAVYYVVSEALANAAKHSQASEVSIAVTFDESLVRATVYDDGVGGAVLTQGSGLIGLVDRVEALGGKLALDSPFRKGTTISIQLPREPRALDERPAL
jgi:signal transduction histidine kinase